MTTLLLTGMPIASYGGAFSRSGSTEGLEGPTSVLIALLCIAIHHTLLAADRPSSSLSSEGSAPCCRAPQLPLPPHPSAAPPTMHKTCHCRRRRR